MCVCAVKIFRPVATKRDCFFNSLDFLCNQELDTPSRIIRMQTFHILACKYLRKFKAYNPRTIISLIFHQNTSALMQLAFRSSPSLKTILHAQQWKRITLWIIATSHEQTFPLGNTLIFRAGNRIYCCCRCALGHKTLVFHNQNRRRT